MCLLLAGYELFFWLSFFSSPLFLKTIFQVLSTVKILVSLTFFLTKQLDLPKIRSLWLKATQGLIFQHALTEIEADR